MTVETDIFVRPATAADAARIAALLTDEGFPAGETDVEDRLASFASPPSTVLVADVGGEVLGFVAVHVAPRFEQGDRFVRIQTLVVDPGVRERGVGHRLMAEAEALAERIDAAFLEVTAGHHRPDARRFFESLGYDSNVTTYLRKRR